MHINPVGAAYPNQMELEEQFLERSNVIVDFSDQAILEGERQQIVR